MELNELKSLVAQAKVNEENAEIARINKENQRKNQIITYLNVNWMGKIREWLNALNYLAENGYKLSSPLFGRYMDIPEVQKNMCTDGVNHKFGLYGSGFGVVYTHFNYMGIEQGGACGPYNIFTDGFTWWTENGCEGVRYQMRLRDYETLISHYKDNPNRLEEFEQNFNKLIDMIKKKAK